MPEPAKKSMPVPAQKKSDSEALIRSLAELLNETGLSEIEIEENNLRVRVARTMTMPTHLAPSYYAALATAGVSSPNSGASLENHRRRNIANGGHGIPCSRARRCIFR